MPLNLSLGHGQAGCREREFGDRFSGDRCVKAMVVHAAKGFSRARREQLAMGVGPRPHSSARPRHVEPQAQISVVVRKKPLLESGQDIVRIMGEPKDENAETLPCEYDALDGSEAEPLDADSSSLLSRTTECAENYRKNEREKKREKPTSDTSRRRRKETIIVEEPRKDVTGVPLVVKHDFEFDAVYGVNSTSLEIYTSSVKSMIDGVFERGARCSVFTFGQTASGKTFTMIGPPVGTSSVRPDASASAEATGTASASATAPAVAETEADASEDVAFNLGRLEDRGLWVHAAFDLFRHLRNPLYKNLRLFVSFFEIYCNKVHDLLNERKLVRALDTKTPEGVVIKSLVTEEVASVRDLLKFMAQGVAARSTGRNTRNVDSSRSHAILTIELRPSASAGGLGPGGMGARGGTMAYGGSGNSVAGKIAFVDLAGSERGADTLNVARNTQMDGAGINKSLLALKECIRALDLGQTHIPFRDSELTKVLRDLFVAPRTVATVAAGSGGNVASGNGRRQPDIRTLMIATVAASAECVDQTLNTLRYASALRRLRRDAPLASGDAPSEASSALSATCTLKTADNKTTEASEAKAHEAKASEAKEYEAKESDDKEFEDEASGMKGTRAQEETRPETQTGLQTPVEGQGADRCLGASTSSASFLRLTANTNGTSQNDPKYRLRSRASLSKSRVFPSSSPQTATPTPSPASSPSPRPTQKMLSPRIQSPDLTSRPRTATAAFTSAAAASAHRQSNKSIALTARPSTATVSSGTLANKADRPHNTTDTFKQGSASASAALSASASISASASAALTDEASVSVSQSGSNSSGSGGRYHYGYRSSSRSGSNRASLSEADSSPLSSGGSPASFSRPRKSQGSLTTSNSSLSAVMESFTEARDQTEGSRIPSRPPMTAATKTAATKTAAAKTAAPTATGKAAATATNPKTTRTTAAAAAARGARKSPMGIDGARDVSRGNGAPPSSSQPRTPDFKAATPDFKADFKSDYKATRDVNELETGERVRERGTYGRVGARGPTLRLAAQTAPIESSVRTPVSLAAHGGAGMSGSNSALGLSLDSGGMDQVGYWRDRHTGTAGEALKTALDRLRADSIPENLIRYVRQILPPTPLDEVLNSSAMSTPPSSVPVSPADKSRGSLAPGTRTSLRPDESLPVPGSPPQSLPSSYASAAETSEAAPALAAPAADGGGGEAGNRASPEAPICSGAPPLGVPPSGVPPSGVPMLPSLSPMKDRARRSGEEGGGGRGGGSLSVSEVLQESLESYKQFLAFQKKHLNDLASTCLLHVRVARHFDDFLTPRRGPTQHTQSAEDRGEDRQGEDRGNVGGRPSIYQETSTAGWHARSLGIDVTKLSVARLLIEKQLSTLILLAHHLVATETAVSRSTKIQNHLKQRSRQQVKYFPECEISVEKRAAV